MNPQPKFTNAPRLLKPDRRPPKFPVAMLEGLIGKRIVLQERGSSSGAPVITGRLTAVENYLLRVDDCEITGVRNVAHPEFVIVNLSQVSHLHPECEVVLIDDPVQAAFKAQADQLMREIASADQVRSLE